MISNAVPESPGTCDIGPSTGKLALILLIGSLFRLTLATLGHNFDLDSYWIVAQIMDRGGNVYAETYRYNYGPIWFFIIHWINQIPYFDTNLHEIFLTFRLRMAFFLTFVDIAIAIILFRRFSLLTSAFFFLNPISIFITGYHGQFDNLAILTGLIGVFLYETEEERPKQKIVALIFFGLSLVIKHVLFIFPVWLALHERTARQRLLATLVPYGIFFASFLPYWRIGHEGILKNVFLYRSFNNAPLWKTIVPDTLSQHIPYVALFILSLLFLGIFYRRKPLNQSFCIYLIATVVASSAIANQYLAICTVALAIYPNLFFANYSLIGVIFLAGHRDGLHIAIMQQPLPFLFHMGYEVLIWLLFCGLIWTVGKDRAKEIIVNMWNRRRLGQSTATAGVSAVNRLRVSNSNDVIGQDKSDASH